MPVTIRPNPEKRNPLARKVERHVPPGPRSRASHALSTRAAQGRFVLQQCVDCATATYPPRDICPSCWGELAWQDQPRGATVIATTTIRVTTDLYFQAHMPWRIGTVALDAGPMALAHLSQDLNVGDKADMRLMLDKSGNAALFATNVEKEPDMTDKQWREFVIPVQGCTILVTDGHSAIGRATVSALRAAGAASILVGIAPPVSASAELAAMDGVRVLPLDLTDTRSVSECLTDIAGPLDIVVNTARFVRPGNSINDQKRAFDVGVLGLSRLLEACTPMLQGRPSGAFVDIVSTCALAPDPGFSGFSAAEAARLSLIQSYRQQMRNVGVRVLTVLVGAVDDEDHQSIPLPKVAPARVAKGVIDALERGQEQSCVGDAAADAMARWLADPATFIREKHS